MIEPSFDEPGGVQVNGENICETIRELILFNQKEIYRMRQWVSKFETNWRVAPAQQFVMFISMLARDTWFVAAPKSTTPWLNATAKFSGGTFRRKDETPFIRTQQKRFTCCSAHILNRQHTIYNIFVV